MFLRGKQTRSGRGAAVRKMISAMIPVLLVMITGCALVGPDYTPPSPEVKAEWQPHEDPALLPDADLVVRWW
ncbi:MAG: hypothetical protein MI802_05920, partial [Desulfobacterales bacterium]|nr:hypothetical protein [Desulfobacterales bacterium]